MTNSISKGLDIFRTFIFSIKDLEAVIVIDINFILLNKYDITYNSNSL